MKKSKQSKNIPPISGLCIKNLVEVESGYVSGRMRIGRAWFHVSFYQVEIRLNRLWPVGSPNAVQNYFRATALDPDSPFTTMELPGMPGRWIMVIYPFMEYL